MDRLLILALATAASTVPAFASDEVFRGARIRYVESGVTLQRASEPASEEASGNMPFFPGDRLWTDGRGRIELQFPEGSVARLDSRSKLDFVAAEDGDRVVLRLWAGTLILHLAGRGAAGFAVETPAGLVEAGGAALVRLDFEDGEARVSVYDGEATVEGSRGRLVDLVAGERTYVTGGDAPEEARGFDARRTDDFDDWSMERDSREAASGPDRRSLPPEVSPYADELESQGSWYYVSETGYVWRPHVAAGWQPYVNGRWDWSSYGWTWVAGEPWGWATSHYGRWEYSTGIGWYWIPGSVWAPAWVSWAVGDDYVGWCPLGRGDRPVSVESGRAAPRGAVNPGAGLSSWVFASKSDLRAPDLARRRMSLGPAEVHALRAGSSPRARPTRDLQRVTEGATAVPRTINIKPTIGDFVPELGSDNRVTIPVHAPRRPSRDRQDLSGDRSRSAVARKPSPGPANETLRRLAPAASTEGVAAVPRDTGQRETEPKRLAEPDREVLRRIFRPVTQPQQREKPRDGGSERSGTGTGRSAAPRRDTPTPQVHRTAPPAASAPKPAPATPRSAHGESRAKRQH